jgi:S-adenosylmethionine:tRNA ribosyltransferase-isomerase
MKEMGKPGHIPITNYDYDLPDARIAKYPLEDRDASNLLVYRSGGKTGGTGQQQVAQVAGHQRQEQDAQVPGQQKQQPVAQAPGQQEQQQVSHGTGLLEHLRFSQVPGLLDKGDRLYFNATRVVQARLIFRKETGARIEIFILEPYRPADYQLAFSSTQPVEFICLVGNVKKWKEGILAKILEEKDKTGKDSADIDRETEADSTGRTAITGKTWLPDEANDKPNGKQLRLTAEMYGRHDDKFIVRFSWNDPTVSFGEVLERSGSTPIPPYLNREAEAMDAATYQTVYARQDGSVAAPTAGLHFTEQVLGALDEKGIQRHELILHVGAGTFIPVKEENAADHRMHAELVTVDRRLLASLLTGGRRIAVGTTTTRSLESVYWLGVKAACNSDFAFQNLFLDQWDAYEMEPVTSPGQSSDSLIKHAKGPIPLEKAVQALLKKMDEAGIDSFSFHTRLMITPVYRFRVIDGLFTNFHQPRSTLLLLIAAVAGEDWRRIYNYALVNEFRFLSYGDSSLLFL